MKKRLLAEWEAYRELVVPATAGEEQVEDTRRAFYGGAQTLMALILRALSDGRDPTPEDLQMISELDAELREYIAEIKAKYVDGGGQG